MTETLCYQELVAHLETLNAKRSIVVHEAVATSRLLIVGFGLPVATKRPRSFVVIGEPKPPKYINPQDGQMWNGHGRPPKWLQGNRDDYLIPHA